MKNLENSFLKFINKTPPIGKCIICNDNSNIKRSHNCYSYMLNNQSRCLEDLCKKGNCKYINPQPGHQSGMTLFVDTKKTTCDILEMRMMSDNPHMEKSEL